MKFKFNKVGGQVCCQGDDEDFPKFCASCQKKAAAQELAWRQENARRNDLRRQQREEQAQIDAARGNPGKDNQMRIGQGQGQNQNPAPAGCRCGKCGGIKPAAQESPARSAIIARLSSRLPVSDLNSMNDEILAALDKALTASASAPAPAPVLRKLPDPLGINAQLEAAKRPAAPAIVPSSTTLSVAAAISEAESVLQNPLSSGAARLVACSVLQRAKGQVRELPDTMGVKAAEARRAEEARNEEAKRLEEQRITKETSGWDGVNAMVKAAQKEANKNRADYEAVEQARASARNNPNPKLRPLPDPLGLKKLGIIK